MKRSTRVTRARRGQVAPPRQQVADKVRAALDARNACIQRAINALDEHRPDEARIATKLARELRVSADEWKRYEKSQERKS